ncbi:hypothetical protein PENSPDRAFT_682764 [Peniophora sp. CONT]|nr:hypothetical protein PENSPDRAFT_682764 [Peniophora sp. CONT]
MSHPTNDPGIEDLCHAVEVQALGDPVTLRSTDDLRHRAAHRDDTCESTPNRATASSLAGFTTASSFTAVSCTQDGVWDRTTNKVFGVPPLHDGPSAQRSRELRESNSFFASRKTEQVFIPIKHDPCSIPAFNTTHFYHRACPPDCVQVDPEALGGWVKMLHPDGSLYFLKTWQGRCGPFTIITEAYLYADDVLQEVMAFARYMWRYMSLVPEKFTNKDFELVLDVKVDVSTNNVVWSYYFVDHVQRMPFWMRAYNPSVHMRTTERLGVSSPDHLWNTAHFTPAPLVAPARFQRIPIKSSSQIWLESIVTPIRYTAPYPAEVAVRLRKELDYLRRSELGPSLLSDVAHISTFTDSEGNSEPYIEIAGRTMSNIERWRYDCLHGTQVIRHFRGQTVLPIRRPSPLYRALAPLLFYAPLPHLYDCRSIYLDGVLANDVEWTTYVKRLLSEWREFMLYAAILMNANLVFLVVLSIPRASANDSANPVVNANRLVSPAAVLSFSSVLASFGSMIMGLLLIRQHRGEDIIDNPRASKAVLMEKRRSTHFEFELLSVCYSLPSVLLTWSVILSLCAFVVFAQLGSSWPARASTLAVLLIIIMFSFWCIRVGWDSSLGRDFFRSTEHSTSPRRRAAASAMTKTLLRLFASITRLGATNVSRFKGTDEGTKKDKEKV